MRIVFDARSYFMRTGIARYTRGLAHALAASPGPHEWLFLISDHHQPASSTSGRARSKSDRVTLRGWAARPPSGCADAMRHLGRPSSVSTRCGTAAMNSRCSMSLSTLRVCHSTSRQMPSAERLICGRAEGAPSSEPRRVSTRRAVVSGATARQGRAGLAALVGDRDAHARVWRGRALVQGDVGGVESIEQRAPGRVGGRLTRGDAGRPDGCDEGLRASLGAARRGDERCGRLRRRGCRSCRAGGATYRGASREVVPRCSMTTAVTASRVVCGHSRVVEQMEIATGGAHLVAAGVHDTERHPHQRPKRRGWVVPGLAQIPRGRFVGPDGESTAVARRADDRDGFGQRDERAGR